MGMPCKVVIQRGLRRTLRALSRFFFNPSLDSTGTTPWYLIVCRYIRKAFIYNAIHKV
jgi:hypothetical protein